MTAKEIELHFSGSDPTPRERAGLNADYKDWIDACNGSSGDDEYAAATNLIHSLMHYAGISEA